MAFWGIAADGRIRIYIQAGPGASRSEIVGVRPDCLRVRIAAAPEKGKANAALIEFMAKAIGLRKTALELESGDTSRHKCLLAPAECLEAIKALGSDRAGADKLG